MELPLSLRRQIARALQAGKQPLEIAREFGLSLLTVADVILQMTIGNENEADSPPGAGFVR